MFKIRGTGTAIEFYIDGVKYATNTTNVPNGALGPVMQIKNTEAANKTVDYDYVHFTLKISR
ncbi:hypothetical protein D3C83_142230 [compost metagenome]